MGSGELLAWILVFGGLESLYREVCRLRAPHYSWQQAYAECRHVRRAERTMGTSKKEGRPLGVERPSSVRRIRVGDSCRRLGKMRGPCGKGAAVKWSFFEPPQADRAARCMSHLSSARQRKSRARKYVLGLSVPHKWREGRPAYLACIENNIRWLWFAQCEVALWCRLMRTLGAALAVEDKGLGCSERAYDQRASYGELST